MSEAITRESRGFNSFVRVQLRMMLKISYSVRKLLDISESLCECCGRGKRNKWDDFKLYNELGAIQTKLKKWIERLDNGTFNEGPGGDWSDDD